MTKYEFVTNVLFTIFQEEDWLLNNEEKERKKSGKILKKN